MSADEKRRVLAIIRTSDTTGYYVDFFYSDQLENDYLYHNLGDQHQLYSTSGKALELLPVESIGKKYHEVYSYFKRPRSISYEKDFKATWSINVAEPFIMMDMWMLGQEGRKLYHLEDPIQQ